METIVLDPSSQKTNQAAVVKAAHDSSLKKILI